MLHIYFLIKKGFLIIIRCFQSATLILCLTKIIKQWLQWNEARLQNHKRSFTPALVPPKHKPQGVFRKAWSGRGNKLDSVFQVPENAVVRASVGRRLTLYLSLSTEFFTARVDRLVRLHGCLFYLHLVLSIGLALLSDLMQAITANFCLKHFTQFETHITMFLCVFSSFHSAPRVFLKEWPNTKNL